MKRILITGVRAPVALELIRRLAKYGYEVFAADSIWFPISRGSRYISKYFYLPEPTGAPHLFAAKLIDIIRNESIDMLIPTCEEVFYISRFRAEISKYCNVFCEDFLLLSQLHNKFKFNQLATSYGLSAPSTVLITSKNDMPALTSDRSSLVFKPVFSRFASQTKIQPSEFQFNLIHPTIETPWVAQKYILGQEYCTYTIAVAGKIQAHVTYLPLYKAGIGSSIYFQSVEHPIIYANIAKFISALNFTGQIGFDCIEDSSGAPYFIECNPRATSGAHCLLHELNWDSLFAGNLSPKPNSNNNRNISLAMLIFSFKNFNKKFIKDLVKTKDVIWDRSDYYPAFYQFINLAEIIAKSIKRGISLKDAATADIEWNGQEI